MKNPDSLKCSIVNQREATDQELSEHGLDQVIDYWNELRGDVFAPLWKSFDFFNFSAKIISGMAVYDIIGNGENFKVRFWGTGMASAFGFDATGKKYFDLNHYGILDGIGAATQIVVVSKEPQFIVHTIRFHTGSEYDFPFVRLPFSDNGETVTNILTAENIHMSMVIE
jgi:hypothetical protein